MNQTIRDLRRANEELKANNEESLSLNEEFLSANEELETSKEELQSLNEELTTVNAQLRQTLNQQQQTSTDLVNLLNSTGVATLFLDTRLKIKMFNPAIKALFAIVDGDVGRPIGDLLPKFADPMLLGDITALGSRAEPIEREIRAETGAWFLRTVQPYRSELGDIEGAVVTFSDVSQLKHAELDAAAARRYAETVVDAIGEPVVVLEPTLKIISSNAAFLKEFGPFSETTDDHTLPSLGHGLLRHPELRASLGRLAQQIGPDDSVELELEAPDSQRARVWRASARRFQLAPGQPPMILLTLSDITNQRHVVQQQLQMMVDALPGAVVAVDTKRRIKFGNKRTEALLGYTFQELIGREIDILVPQAYRNQHVLDHNAFITSPTARSMAARLDIAGVTKQGEEIPLDISLSPVPTAEGLLVIAAMHDLRPQKQFEKTLRDAKAEADRANQAKSRFLSAASHDLRQPLQTIVLLLGMVEKWTADPQARSIFGKLDDAVSGMVELLDTLLDINQIESGAITANVTDFPVANVLARKIGEYSALAAARGLTLRAMPSSLSIRSDRVLLERIIGNLLSNAINYTDRGKILLGCRRRGDKLAIEVWDTGIGIPEDRQKAVFDEFYRVDRNDSSRFGLGLGLYIVQRFAQLLGHAVEIRSRPGKGTMFAVLVPVVATNPLLVAGTTHFETGSAQVSPLILLVEDEREQLATLKELLEHEGYRVVGARNAKEALTEIHGPDGLRPDMLVCDYNLPGAMNGLEIVQRVRTELRSNVPALIATADMSRPTRLALEASGLVSLTKPVKTADLMAAVETLVRLSVPGWAGKKRSSKPLLVFTSPVNDPTVGVIDDEPAVCEAFRLILEAAGHRVATYASSESFFADPNRKQLQCLVVDMTLPGMDGLELHRRLKAEGHDVPIIFATGRGDLPLAVNAMRAGAADFLQKPVRGDDLLDSVAQALEGQSKTRDIGVERANIDARLAVLTERERQVLDCMMEGKPTKIVAAQLGISTRTAEHHRQSVMRKMGAKSLAMLIRMIG